MYILNVHQITLQAENSTFFSGKDTDKITAQNAPKHAILLHPSSAFALPGKTQKLDNRIFSAKCCYYCFSRVQPVAV